MLERRIVVPVSNRSDSLQIHLGSKTKPFNGKDFPASRSQKVRAGTCGGSAALDRHTHNWKELNYAWVAPHSIAGQVYCCRRRRPAARPACQSAAQACRAGADNAEKE